MNWFELTYTALGGLGIFFFGMRQMSDGLQQAASDVITKVINSLTSNRFMAVVVGIVITVIVQSSSVTTVMVVGFVNAGLMQLTQALGVILGSNIGTTITGWIISIKVGKYGLLFIGIGIFPILFSKNPKWKQIGQMIFGVGMIFFGLTIMSGAFKPLRSDPDFLNMISYFSHDTYTSYFASIIIGCLLTVVIQSSSAMLGITIAMAMTGAIGFNTAAALVLGENIGTTITALLASVGTTTNAKRAARGHAIFNLIAASMVFCILPYYLDFIEWLIPGEADFVAPDGSKPNIAQHIAMSHTFFNVSATIVFLPFLGLLTKIVIKITPEKDEDKRHALVMVGDMSEILPATAIVQASSEVKRMKGILDKMYLVSRDYLENQKPMHLAKVQEYERITDNIQKEVTVFCCRIMEKPMSADQTRHIQALIKIVDEYESIADYLERIVKYRSRFAIDSISGKSREEYYEIMDKVWEFYEFTSKGLTDSSYVDFNEVVKRSEKLRIMADHVRDNHVRRVSKGEYEPLSALTYSDMVVALRKIRAHAMNVSQALTTINSIET